LLISNPRSRFGDADLTPVAALLERRGIEVVCHAVDDPAQIPAVIDGHAAGIDGVLLAGGDGTFNTALPAVCRHGLVMGLLPLGTANDLAGTLEIPTDLAAAAEVIAAGRVVRIDLGEANGRLFFNVAHIGLPVAVAAEITDSEKRRWGVIGYLRALRRALRDDRTFRARIACDGRVMRGRFVQVTVGNGRRHGGGMVVDPEAGLTDGRLHLYAVRPQRWWRLLYAAAALRSGHAGPPELVWRLAGEAVRVETQRPLEVATDGEITTRTPVAIRVLRSAIAVYAPATFVQALEGRHAA
jgi:YegS/Rv2252/BmrU family lipid kinase